MNKIKEFFASIPSLFKKVIKSDGTKSVVSSIISIVAGIVIGFIVMILVAIVMNTDENPVNDCDPFGGIGILLSGPFSSTIKAYVLTNAGDMIFYSVPLIMTGLSVALAYKTGLFNIGAPGQYLMGTIGALLVALSLHSESEFGRIMIWVLAVVTGMICGMIWGIIPGVLKAYFNINEVIICIMTNWIAANLASWIFAYTPNLWSTENTKGGYLGKVLENYTPKFGLDEVFKGSYIDGGIFFAIIIAIVVYIVMNKTTFGYELKACGFNKNASKYAGLNEKRNIILSMAISGGLAALGACFYYLNGDPRGVGIEFKFISQYQSLPSYGFNGIASAFLANCNPIAVVITSLFIRYLNMGGEALTKVGYNRYVADIVIAVIIYLAGFSRIIREWLSAKKKEIQKKEPTVITKKEDVKNG